MNQKWQEQKSHLIFCDDHWQECCNCDVNKEHECVCVCMHGMCSGARTQIHTISFKKLCHHQTLSNEQSQFHRIPPCVSTKCFFFVVVVAVSSFFSILVLARIQWIHRAKMYMIQHTQRMIYVYIQLFKTIINACNTLSWFVVCMHDYPPFWGYALVLPFVRAFASYIHLIRIGLTHFNGAVWWWERNVMEEEV